jgi:hypothetical protein
MDVMVYASELGRVGGETSTILDVVCTQIQAAIDMEHQTSGGEWFFLLLRALTRFAKISRRPSTSTVVLPPRRVWRTMQGR